MQGFTILPAFRSTSAVKPDSAVVAIEGERVANLDDAHSLAGAEKSAIGDLVVHSESTCLNHAKDTRPDSHANGGGHENCLPPPSKVPVLLGRIEFDFQRFGVYSLTVLGVHLTCLPLVAVC